MASPSVAHWHIECLASGHDRDSFCCGKPVLDTFLKKLAGQYARKGFAVTYVALNPPETKVYGYYSVCLSAVATESLPEETRRKLPSHPMPCLLLGRLAVDQQARGRRLGETLLIDALARCLRASHEFGIHAVEVHAIDDQARAFYLKYGFVPLLDDPLHLYLPMKTIEKLLGSG